MSNSSGNSYELRDRDVEKNTSKLPNAAVVGLGNISSEKRPSYVYDDGAVPGESFNYGEGFYAKAQRFAGKLNIEQRGIERVPEDERTDTSMLNVSTMWLSANMVVSSFAIGVLGPQLFYTGFVDGILVILFFNLLGIFSVCFFSSFGPAFGLRQMVLSRFWFGWYGVKLIAFFNVCACIGWSSVNTIVGAQLLHAVNTDVPGWAGILIIAIITAAICTFGYRIVHAYEFWSWIPTTIIFFVLIGEYAQTDAFYNIPMYHGKAELGACLSFGATVFGFATGWTSYAADYTVYQPSHTSKKKVFFWTWLGLIIPLLFTEMLGLAVACAANQSEDDPNFYQIAYNDGGIGGLLGSVMFPDTFGSAKRGFGKFCLVVLALSIIANNCPNIYSVALTMQMIGKWAQKVPRFVWTIIGTACYIAIAIPGYSHFEEYLEDFLNFIGYWLAIYQSIAFVDHFWFRRGFKGYIPEDYDNPKALPPGIAAVSAFCVGVAGMVLGMSQVFWVGPIALTAGDAPYGGDVGFELGALFAATSYLVFRTIEKRIFGR